ncbi:MAG: NVEALA domain-containing protein [Bacteroidales bacterium]|nr:NVEALA domain-containing protein [Bacteroidales bacterium]
MKKIFGMVAIAVVAAVNVVAAFDSASIMNELGFANIESLADNGEIPMYKGKRDCWKTKITVRCQDCNAQCTVCESDGNYYCTPYVCAHLVMKGINK